jgi:SAM-dependent methyltransferase
MLAIRFDDGDAFSLDRERWYGEPNELEQRILQDLPAPMLDVGCGPGRIVAALARRGVPALGVDPAPAAVTLARRRGASALERSVFDHLPGEGRWGTVLLLDGNIGIGGDAVRLLRRCRKLIAPAGIILVEVEPPGRRSRARWARLERGASRSPWFPWAVVGADAVDELAGQAGLVVARLDHGGGRWFAYLGRVDAAA